MSTSWVGTVLVAVTGTSTWVVCVLTTAVPFLVRVWRMSEADSVVWVTVWVRSELVVMRVV